MAQVSDASETSSDGSSESSSDSSGVDTETAASTSTGQDGGSIGGGQSTGPEDATAGSTMSGSTTTSGESTCGDGEVQPTEECDIGIQDDADRCTDACVRERIAFVSSVSYKASSLKGDWGDKLCNKLAGLAKLPGADYHAWLSAPNRDIKQVLPPNLGIYIDSRGSLIAASWDDLVNGDLEAPIEYNEFGEQQSAYVWTGTLPGGGLASDHCQGWTSTSGEDSGSVGFSGFKDEGWTELSDPNPLSCDIARHIYCIEW